MNPKNNVKNIIILSNKIWNTNLPKELNRNSQKIFSIISKKEDLKLDKIKDLNLEFIFVVHWSYKIPKEIWSNYRTIIFHMTDLPYGRGGSPLQNLIVRGKKKTKISALKIDEGIDSGPIYLKREMSLDGSAQKIFNRSTKIIENMIVEILNKKPIPIQQTGEPVYFKRRSPEDGCINGINEIQKIHDHIRMLDAEGYPPAYLETESFKIDFYNSKLINKFKITANVRITKK